MCRLFKMNKNNAKEESGCCLEDILLGGVGGGDSLSESVSRSLPPRPLPIFLCAVQSERSCILGTRGSLSAWVHRSVRPSVRQPRSPMSLSTGGGTLGMTVEPVPAVR